MGIGRVFSWRRSTAWALATCTGCGLVLGGCGGDRPFPRLSGYEIVRTKETVSGRTGHSVKVSCPAGKQPVGGGWSGATPTLIINSSAFMPPPSPRRAHLGNRWHVWVGNYQDEPQEIEVAAVCVWIEAFESQ